MSATQKFFRFVFGQNGDRAAVPDTTPVDGSVGYQQGYGFDYQRAPGDGLVKNIERNKWNQLLFDITLGLRQYQTNGFPEFIESFDNGGFPYPYAKNAFVRWTDGQVYVSLVDNNTSTPADLSKWSLGILGTGVGAVQFFPANVPPVGYLKANGPLLQRAAYPALWAYAQASGNMAVSDGAWQRGQFSPGDGVNTFRIPDARGYHPRAWDDGAGIDPGRVLGSAQSDAFPFHVHPVVDHGHDHLVNDPGHVHAYTDPRLPDIGGTSYQNGPQAYSWRAENIGANNTGSAQTGIDIYPAGTGVTVAGAGSGSETRVKTLAWLACIKYL